MKNDVFGNCFWQSTTTNRRKKYPAAVIANDFLFCWLFLLSRTDRWRGLDVKQNKFAERIVTRHASIFARTHYQNARNGWVRGVIDIPFHQSINAKKRFPKNLPTHCWRTTTTYGVVRVYAGARSLGINGWTHLFMCIVHIQSLTVNLTSKKFLIISFGKQYFLALLPRFSLSNPTSMVSQEVAPLSMWLPLAVSQFIIPHYSWLCPEFSFFLLVSSIRCRCSLEGVRRNWNRNNNSKRRRQKKSYHNVDMSSV